MTRIGVLMFFGAITGILAVASPTRDMAWKDQKDLGFIRDWEKDQRIIQLTKGLELSGEQIASLHAIRGEIDNIKADMAPRFEAWQSAFTVLTGDIRRALEQGGTFGESDRVALRAMRHDYRRLKREERLRAGLATLPMADLLNQEQMALLKGNAAGLRTARRSMRHDGIGPSRPGKRSVARRGARRLVRILLSDTFLHQLPKP